LVGPVHAQQGREKRMRFECDEPAAGEESAEAFADRIATFKFPTPQKLTISTGTQPGSAPASPTRAHAP
jgi:hypothetical protein